jgi:hypothetical protein
MGISLISRVYSYENITGSSTFLKGVLLKRVTCNIVLEVQTFIKASANNDITYGDDNYQTTDYITDQNGTRFKDFNVGDTISISGTASGTPNGTGLTIIEKISDSTVRVDTSFGSNYTETEGIIRVTDEPKAISYRFGLIENDEPTNFLSKIDEQEQLFTYEHPTQIPVTFQDMSPRGKLCWLVDANDLAQVKRVSSDLVNNIYRFEIQHVIYIYPPFRLGQLENLQVLQAPDYFDLGSSLKHVFELNSYNNGYDPNPNQTITIDDIRGDTGWYNEENNGREPDYKLDSIAYSNDINTIDYSTTTGFTIVIDEFGGVPVKYADIHFMVLPESVTDYKNKQSYVKNNLVLDRAAQVEGAASVNGENFGTDLQAITNVTFASAAGKTTITGTIDLGTFAKLTIESRLDKYFVLSVDCTGDALTASDFNSVNVLCDVRKADYQLTVGTIDVTTDFLVHSQNSYAPQVDGITGFLLSEEEAVGRSIILIDKTEYPDILLDNLTVQLIAKDSNEVAILEEKIYNIQSNPILSGNRFVNTVSPTGYNVLSTEIRANYRIERFNEGDTGNKIAYRVIYPFYYRWEYWKQLQLSTLPSDFLDTTKEFNGYNQNWDRLGNLSGWDNYLRISTTVINNTNFRHAYNA